MPRPRTRWFCRWKPRREPERKFTAQDAARITCYAVRQGAKKADIDRRYRVICQGREEERKSAAEAAMEIALEALEGNNESLLEAYKLFLVVNAILLGIIALTRVLPAPVLRPISIAASAARTSVAAITRVNISRRAANDAAYKVIEKALIEFRRAA